MSSRPLLQNMIRDARSSASKAREGSFANSDHLADAVTKLADVLESILLSDHSHPVSPGTSTLRTYEAKVVE